MPAKGYKAYLPIVRDSIPRLKDGDEEADNRARMLFLRDHAQKEREKASWHDDMILVDIISLVGPYALSSKLRADQIASLWCVCSDLATVVSKLRAIGLG